MFKPKTNVSKNLGVINSWMMTSQQADLLLHKQKFATFDKEETKQKVELNFANNDTVELDNSPSKIIDNDERADKYYDSNLQRSSITGNIQTLASLKSSKTFADNLNHDLISGPSLFNSNEDNFNENKFPVNFKNGFIPNVKKSINKKSKVSKNSKKKKQTNEWADYLKKEGISVNDILNDFPHDDFRQSS